MHHQENVDVVPRCKLSQLGDYEVLQIKLVVASGLVCEHELEVVKAHDADVVGNDRILQRFKNLLWLR